MTGSGNNVAFRVVGEDAIVGAGAFIRAKCMISSQMNKRRNLVCNLSGDRHDHQDRNGGFDMSGRDRFEHESIQDKRQVQQFFIALVDGIAKGRFILQKDNDQAELILSELIRFSIKAKKKTGKSKMTITLAWKDSAIGTYRKKCDEICISK